MLGNDNENTSAIKSPALTLITVLSLEYAKDVRAAGMLPAITVALRAVPTGWGVGTGPKDAFPVDGAW